MLSTLILNKPNIRDFAKERNDLLKKSKTEWVLFIDNDETIDSITLWANYKLQITNNKQITCYKLIRKNYFLGQYVGSDKIIRLVKKGTGKFVRKVHEVWKPDRNEKIGIRSETIIHNTADNLKDYLIKINNYSDLHAKANLEEAKQSSLLKIIFYPIGKFVVTLIKSKNIVFSIMQSLHSFLSWSKLYFLQH